MLTDTKLQKIDSETRKVIKEEYLKQMHLEIRETLKKEFPKNIYSFIHGEGDNDGWYSGCITKRCTYKGEERWWGVVDIGMLGDPFDVRKMDTQPSSVGHKERKIIKKIVNKYRQGIDNGKLEKLKDIVSNYLI